MLAAPVLPAGLDLFPAMAVAKPAITAAATARRSESLSIPILHSLPSAAVKVYLDFDGDVTTRWKGYTPGTTPPFDLDDHPSVFSTREIAAIRQIWTRVAEAYSPFNVDVTTQNPGSFTNRQALHVVIGGRGKWLGDLSGGVAWVDAFTNKDPNVLFVFPDNLGDDDLKAIGMAAAHEVAHAFGLEHESVWRNGRVIEDYNSGTPVAAPIMGMAYDSARGLWWKGTSALGPHEIQDELAVLSSAKNGFGYRADDVGNRAADARELALDAPAHGVIGTSSDVDYYSFHTDGGYADILFHPAESGAMLAYRLLLLDSDGNILHGESAAAVGRSINTFLPAGRYYLRVASRGGYGDVGQYSIEVDKGFAPPAAPTSVDADARSDQTIRVRWAEGAGTALGFIVERSTDGETWSALRRVKAGVYSLDDTDLPADTVFYYRVKAYNRTGASPYSRVARGRTWSRPISLGQ